MGILVGVLFVWWSELLSMRPFGWQIFQQRVLAPIFGLVFITMGVVGLYAVYRSLFKYATIIIDNEGISARSFGKIRKFIRWSDVTKIRKTRFRWPGPTPTYSVTFEVFDAAAEALPRLKARPNLNGAITFTDKILNIRNLLDNINKYSLDHNIDIYINDPENGVSIARSRSNASEVKVPEL
jgi:hypothetical protein